MKTLLFISCIILTASCTKRGCYTCEYKGNSGTTTQQYCDKTKKEIKEIEKTPATDVNAQPVTVSCR